jgi:hypothetical protein
MKLSPTFYLISVLVWLGICALVSVTAGWSRLARDYRARRRVQGERLRFVSGAMGCENRLPVRYNNCLSVAVNEAGFGLSVSFLFRLCSPPLFIPWSAVKSIETKIFLSRRCALIRLHGQPVTIALNGRAGERVLSAYAGRQ